MMNRTSIPSSMSRFDDAHTGGDDVIVTNSVNANINIFFGLGGTGAEVIKRTKALCSRPGMRSLSAFVVLDTDERAKNGSGQHASLTDDEFHWLSLKPVETLLAAPDKHPSLAKRFNLYDSTVRNRLLSKVRAGINQASQDPLIGCMALVTNYHSVRSTLQRTINKVTGAYEGVQVFERQGIVADANHQVNLIFATSSCGGTGTGITIDTIANVADLARGLDARISLYCFLPSIFECRLRNSPDQVARTEALNYAFLSTLDALNEGLGERNNIQFGFDAQNCVRFPAGLIPQIYLIEDRAANGVAWQTPEASFDVVAQHLAYGHSTPMADILVRSQSNKTTLEQTDLDSGRLCRYGSISATALEFPAERLASRMCDEQLQRAIANHIGNPGSAQPGGDDDNSVGSVDATDADVNAWFATALPGQSLIKPHKGLGEAMLSTSHPPARSAKQKLAKRNSASRTKYFNLNRFRKMLQKEIRTVQQHQVQSNELAEHATRLQGQLSDSTKKKLAELRSLSGLRSVTNLHSSNRRRDTRQQLGD